MTWSCHENDCRNRLWSGSQFWADDSWGICGSQRHEQPLPGGWSLVPLHRVDRRGICWPSEPKQGSNCRSAESRTLDSVVGYSNECWSFHCLALGNDHGTRLSMPRTGGRCGGSRGPSDESFCHEGQQVPVSGTCLVKTRWRPTRRG